MIAGRLAKLWIKTTTFFRRFSSRNRKISYEKLHLLLRQGVSQAQIARQYGISRQAVNQRIHYRSKIKQKERLARRLVAQGLSLAEIRAGLGHKQRISTENFLISRMIPFKKK